MQVLTLDKNTIPSTPELLDLAEVDFKDVLWTKQFFSSAKNWILFWRGLSVQVVSYVAGISATQSRDYM